MSWKDKNKKSETAGRSSSLYREVATALDLEPRSGGAFLPPARAPSLLSQLGGRRPKGQASGWDLNGFRPHYVVKGDWFRGCGSD